MKWLRNFMYGRYGVDQLGNFFIYSLYYFSGGFFCISSSYIYLLSNYYFIHCLECSLNNNYKRRAENDWYLQKTAGIRKFFKRQQNKWKYRKTHKYLKCPHCHQYLRVPRGKGEITVTCPSCHQQFDQRT